VVQVKNLHHGITQATSVICYVVQVLNLHHCCFTAHFFSGMPSFPCLHSLAFIPLVAACFSTKRAAIFMIGA
jgi:hypothetical protein